MATVALIHNSVTFASPINSASASSGEQVRLAEKLQLCKRLAKKPISHNNNNNNNNNTAVVPPTALTAQVEILGHRGALYEGIENTLESFASCLELDGCRGVELDVFLLKDGNLVVFHGTGTDQTPGLLQHICEEPVQQQKSLSMDDDDNNTINSGVVVPPKKSMSILDLTLRQAQALRFLEESEHLVSSKELVSRARIPTLRQVLELFQKYPDKRMKVELKGEGCVRPTVELVQEMNKLDQVVMSFFKHNRIQEAKEICSAVRTGAIFTGAVPCNFLQIAKQAQADEIHLRYDTCCIDRVEAAHKYGFHVMAWFRGPKAMKQDILSVYSDARNEADTYDMVLKSGVDAICCNRPHLAVKLLRKLRGGRDPTSIF